MDRHPLYGTVVTEIRKPEKSLVKGFQKHDAAKVLDAMGAYGVMHPAINVPIQCGGVTVNPGDLILGGDGGVVVVPFDEIQAVLAGADAHLAGELSRLERVQKGEKPSAVNHCDEKTSPSRPRFST